jgi:transposase
MYRVAMYYTIKTLFEKGHSRRQISRQLGIHRRTVSAIITQIQQGLLNPQPVARGQILQPYDALIEQKIQQGLSARLIHDWLVDELHCTVSYPSVARYVRKFNRPQTFVPMYSDPGDEAQVDFGYLGRFNKNGKKLKVWCFAMTLSHSRMGFYRLVTDQRVETFIACHIHAFEFFTGVPRTVVLDNLKAGVVKASFYEPVFQTYYASMLEHYGSSPIAARPRRPQDKGKVESAIKYVKGNFLPTRRHLDYHELESQLERWTIQVANPRVHGTTRKIPLQVWQHTERVALGRLPLQRFELWDIQHRKVSRFGHVVYGYNYYSVPSQYTDQMVSVHCNHHVIKIFSGQDCVATHARCIDQGKYITQSAHQPSKGRTKHDYEQAFRQLGTHAYAFLEALQLHKPRHWHEVCAGILSLRTRWSDPVIDLACRRALYYQGVSYRMVKQIVEQRLWELPLDEEAHLLDTAEQGHGHWLGVYDQLTQPQQDIHATT